MKYEYGISLSQLRTSLKYRSKEYFLENSLHGIPYVMDSSLRKWERIIWFILTVFSLGAAIWVILTIWDKFQREPTLSEVNTSTENIRLDFPQIFLCFDWSQLNHSNLRENERSVYEKVYNWRWSEVIEPLQDELQDKNNFRSDFYSLTPDCDAFYDNCTFSGKEEACSKILTKVVTSVGACCKFNASKTLTITNSSWAFSFAPAIYPFKLYLMNKMDDGPQRDQKPVDVIYEPVAIGIKAYITYTTSEVKMLRRSQRQCHYDGEVLTVNNCELRCLSRRVFAKCGCVPWFLAEFGDYRECFLSEYSCANTSRTGTTDCDCLLPCDHIAYSCHKITVYDPDTNEKSKICKIGLTTWPVMFFRRKIRFGYLDLVVSFGGIAGLFLGYSILTSIEFIYYFSLKVYCSAIVEATRKKHNIIKNIKVHVTEHKVPSKLDVKPICYNYID